MKATREEESRAHVTGARPGLVRTATWLTAGDAHLAEDLVQTTLTRLYVAWPHLRRTYAAPTAQTATRDERLSTR